MWKSSPLPSLFKTQSSPSQPFQKRSNPTQPLHSMIKPAQAHPYPPGSYPSAFKTRSNHPSPVKAWSKTTSKPSHLQNMVKPSPPTRTPSSPFKTRSNPPQSIQSMVKPSQTHPQTHAEPNPANPVAGPQNLLAKKTFILAMSSKRLTLHNGRKR